MEVPPAVAADDMVLRRFLLLLIENLDIAFGNRGNQGFVDAESALGISSNVAEQTFEGQIFTNIKRYSQEFNLNNDRDIVDRGFVLANASNNPEQPAIADVVYTSATPSPAYVQGEAVQMDNGIQANEAKINEILSALRNAGIIGV
jgi:hypothetical protein